MPVELSEEDWAYLTDQISCPLVRGDAELWPRWRAVVPDWWVREFPGTRPRLWWNHDAPRQPAGRWPGRWFDGQLPEPRRRLGGAGVTPWEAGLAYVPCYAHGVPSIWIDAWQVAYYKLDVPAYDPMDPPVYETEAEYLRRHGLLLPGER
jgi:hypothetical protein